MLSQRNLTMPEKTPDDIENQPCRMGRMKRPFIGARNETHQFSVTFFTESTDAPTTELNYAGKNT